MIISTVLLTSSLYALCQAASPADSLGAIPSRHEVTVFETSVLAASLSTDSTCRDSTVERLVNERYMRRVERAHRRWMGLIPNKVMAQYAGNIGMLSIGIGWDYGRKDRWETYLIAGYLPKQESRDDYWTFTLKQMYTPWDVKMYRNFTFQPFYATFMVNTIFSDEFWVREPDRYPSGYYGFSSKVRFHLGIGEKVSFNVPNQRIRWFKRVSAYYELSTCDLYIRQKILNRRIPLKDIFSLGIGIQYKMFE